MNKSVRAVLKDRNKKLVVGGGVSANSYLRKRLSEEAEKNHFEVYFPDKSLSGDNAGMIASEGYFQIVSKRGLANMDLTPAPNINLKWERRKEKNI